MHNLLNYMSLCVYIYICGSMNKSICVYAHIASPPDVVNISVVFGVYIYIYIYV